MIAMTTERRPAPRHESSTAPWPANVREECATIDRCANHLARLATAAETLGLDALSADLYATAQTLDATTRAIRDHNRLRLDEDVSLARQLAGGAVAQTLRAAA